jgi:D-serine deaminase-like pyridoxal phosphate-dependent protein
VRDYRLKQSSEIPTPSLLVYPDLIRANTRQAIRIAGGTGRLRPHVKTHKSPDVLKIQLEAGIERFKCATLAEAQMIAEAGGRDVIVAYPLTGPAVQLLIELAKAYPETTFRPLVESEPGSAALGAAARSAGLVVEALLDLDTGMHRTGIAPQEAPAVYRKMAATPGVAPAGLHAYDGHNHQSAVEERCAAAAETREQTRRLAALLQAEGLPVPRLVVGGTPTFACHAADSDVELSPGTCFLHDGNYLLDHPDLPFEPAAILISRVISLPTEDTLTLDLGHKAVSADPPGARGFLLGFEGGPWSETPSGLAGGEPLGQSEEHWVWRLPEARRRITVGQPAYVLPAHICPTVALHESVLAVGEGGAVTASWPITARGRALRL